MNMIFAIKAIAARAAWAGARVAHICDAWVASMRGASFVRMCGGRGATTLAAASVFLFVASSAHAADAYPPSCFTEMGNDRVLLMNNDNNAQCPITLQSYYDTNTAATTYWTHDGDPAPTDTSQFIDGERMGLFNLKDGTHHILWQRVDSYTNLGGETMVSSNKLWELVNCRAGSIALATSDSNTPRNYFPWTMTSLDIDTGAAMPSATYNRKAGAGLVIMQNTTDACIISPFYANGVGAIYFDAVNGWCGRTGELVLEIATETTDGSYFSERSTNLRWETQKVDVLEVSNLSRSATVATRYTDVDTISLDQQTDSSSYKMGSHYFRIRADVSCRKPIRFRIRRTTAVSAVSQLDSPTYMLVDNIMASYPPLGLEVDIPGKQFDPTREKKRVLGWEGALKDCFAFTGQEGAQPVARFPETVSTEFGDFDINAFGLKDIKFNYRWTYLGIASGDWQTFDMAQDSSLTNIQSAVASGLSLTNETGDIEFYYTMTITNSPHFWPTDFALGTKISTKLNGTDYKAPYGSDWEEGGGSWTHTCRRAASDEKLPSGGTDWFFRLRDGYTDYEDVAVVAHYKSGEETVTSNLWMELVGEHSWRAYVYMPTNMAGKTMTFSFAGYNRQDSSAGGFEVNTNEWKFSSDRINYLPYSGVADGDEAATVTFDLASTHLLFEFNDKSGAFAISHAAFQDFNLWTDAAGGYMGYYSTTAAVAEAKQEYPEDFDSWQPSSGYCALWHEDFNVSGTITNTSPFYPGKPFGADWPTPHGWTANNGMFVCEAYTNTEDGLALELEGCGRGTVELKNLSPGDVPAGLGSVDFTARIAQPYSMDNFAYSLAAYRETNYAFSVKTTLSTRQGTDMSLSDPTVSLVAYYRPGMGCYEARAKRVSATVVELSIWKWEWAGNSLSCRQIGKSAYMGRPAINGTLDTTHALLNESATDSNRYQLWHTMSISAYNTSAGTVVQTRLARYQSGYSIQLDRPAAEGGRYADQRYIIVTATDNDANKFTSGAYGMGTVNCSGYFGYPQFHQGMSNSTNFPYYGSTVKLLSDTDLDLDWSIPSRYRKLNTRNEYGRNELAAFSWRPNTSVSAENHTRGWECGLAALVPNQNVAIRYQTVGGLEWIDVGNVTVTNFQSTYYTFSPQVVDDCYVQLAAGGTRYDTCVDVAVDNIGINSWRGRSTDLNGNYGRKDDWIYTDCWIESAVGVSGGYTVQPVSGTNDYCYIFTNAGETVTFTPRSDLYISQALVVGGGGAGGWAGGGGGGGGVYVITNGTWVRAGEPVTITVGEGGNNYYSSLYNQASYIQRGGNGTLSRLTINGEDYTAYGGGGGASYYTYYGVGNNNNSGMPLATGGGNANTSQGATTRGANGLTTRMGGLGGGGDGGITMCYASGGGGGAGGNGVRGTTNNLEFLDATHILLDSYGGDGGPGVTNYITGTAVVYGGGGGGGDGRIFTSTVNYGGHIYYQWNTGGKYYMLRNSTYNSNLGLRAPGNGGEGGGGKGGATCIGGGANLEYGGDGVNGLGGGGGGGSSWGGSTFRAGGKGGNGAVILRIANLARNQCVIQPTRAVSTQPCGLRSPWLANGLSSIRFTYTGADTNAVLLLQVSTNMTSTSEIYNRTKALSDGWETIERFTFTDTNALSGAKASYFSYRAPAKGLMRLISDPNVILESADQEDPAYGSVAITSILCYDEPPLDARSWTGWNMWTVGWGLYSEPHWSTYTLDGHTVTNSFAYLYDGYDGFSCSLNFSAMPDDNKTGVTDDEDSDLKDPDRTLPADKNEYALSYPYVQGPAMTNGIGYVQFRARRDNSLQDTPSVVTLFGLTNPSEPETAEELTNIVVNSDRYSLYTWRTTADQSGYQAIRLAVKGAKGNGGRETPDPAYYTPQGYDPTSLTPIQKLQRVWIDDVAFSEPIAPRLALLNARPFRMPLTETVVVTNILKEEQQPLTKESFGFQVLLQPQQLADDIDFSSIEVYLAYYVGTEKWGWRNWTNDPSAVWSKLKRVTTNMVWRSTYDNPASIVPGQSTPGTAVQYFLQARYNDNSGKSHTHEIDSVDWDGGPTWYWPVDYNTRYGDGTAATFSPYTLLDSVSPRCAWINEVNYYDGRTNTGTGWSASENQFIELAVPAGADMTGWYLRVQGRDMVPCTLFTIGYGDIAKSTSANPVNHYSFLTVASPKTYAAGTLGDAPSGKWEQNSTLAYYAEITDGELIGNSPYAFELVRPSGIIEHQVVMEGTNQWAGQRLEWYGSGTNLCANLKNSNVINGTNFWFFAGSDKDEGTLSVFRSHGEDASCWTNSAPATPAKINSTVGQTGEDWYLPISSGEFAWIYVTIAGGHMYVMDGANKSAAAVFMVEKDAATNVTFQVDPWYQVASMTTNGTTAPDALGKRGTYTLPLPGVSSTMDVYASAGIAANVTDGISPYDPYYNAVVNWLCTEHADGDTEIHPARFIGLSGAVTNELSLKEMYWLDIPPNESGWIFRAGMGGGLRPPGSQGRLPVEPVTHNRPGVGLVTNVRMTVFLQITNDETDVCYAPDHLRGLDGSSSYSYTGSPNWTSVTFKVTGALQNGLVDNLWRPLRWFVFGPGSFGAPGTPDEYTATIEIDDPFTMSSPALSWHWYEFPGTPVFYSWTIDEERKPQSTEMLKQDSTYED